MIGIDIVDIARMTKAVEIHGDRFLEKVFTAEEIAKVKSMYPSQYPKQVLQVGLQRRYSEYYQMVKDMADKGMLGDVKFVYAQWHRNPGWLMKPGNWRLFRKTSGGIAAELASLTKAV